jgi:hypothetical protein
MSSHFHGFTELKGPIRQGEGATRTDDVDVIGLDRLGLVDLVYRECAVVGEDFRHRALAVRREVLHNHERDTGLGWHRLEERLERIDPASGSADADYRKRQASAADKIDRRRQVRRSARVGRREIGGSFAAHRDAGPGRVALETGGLDHNTAAKNGGERLMQGVSNERRS